MKQIILLIKYNPPSYQSFTHTIIHEPSLNALYIVVINIKTG